MLVLLLHLKKKLKTQKKYLLLVLLVDWNLFVYISISVIACAVYSFTKNIKNEKKFSNH